MKFFQKSTWLTLSLFSTILLSCLSIASFPNNGKAQKSLSKNILRVALYPYIPDAANDKYRELLQRIETEFEGKNPDIDLVLKPIKDDGFYELDTLKTWLTESPSNNGYHLVEIDTLLLGDLVELNLIQAWNAPSTQSDWHPAGKRGVTLNNQVYGIPHWLCGNFIFSRDKSVVKAKSITELLPALDQVNPKTPNVAGNLTGWDLPTLYLDAWADTYGLDEIASAISTSNPDKVVMQSFNKFSKECVTNGKNPCLDGTYNDANLSAKNFADGKVDTFFGYSERLNFILKEGVNTKDVKISSIPLGQRKNPILFVDAFVLRNDCNKACQEAAAKFVAYMNAPQTHEWILMSQDAGNQAIPRYLIPATLSAFQTPEVRQNSYYRVIESETKKGLPYPNSGFTKIREEMEKNILNELEVAPQR
ncbi:thiaminase-1 [Scytonema sp. HK-05]|uniref:extracellular solute-binding protein n=1 Tax=Scytonema sp. HK-05 TaxID=1137095 RepID=UPI00093722D2|nr:extracellular solute-binding protein [Scytonema sp. HK-05]OKH60963.1 hypothetical protein NIES2130_00265 [Scytonema sp. HK-05]BAY46336.1 thiaminase-1 [Scytonema sp. HK-05]